MQVHKSALTLTSEKVDKYPGLFFLGTQEIETYSWRIKSHVYRRQYNGTIQFNEERSNNNQLIDTIKF